MKHAWIRSGGTALALISALTLTGCASQDAPADAESSENSPSAAGDNASDHEVEDQAPAANQKAAGLTAESIIAAVEAEGLTCAPKEPRIETRAEVVVCKGDDHVVITGTRLTDAGLVDKETAAAKKATCESGFKLDGTRFAVSDAWILAPGGGDKKNLAAFDAAMNTLGLDWSLDPC